MAGGASGLADALRAAGATAAASKAAKAKAAEGDDCAKRCADIASTTKQDEEFIGWYTHLIQESYHYSSILYLYYIYTISILYLLYLYYIYTISILYLSILSLYFNHISHLRYPTTNNMCVLV